MQKFTQKYGPEGAQDDTSKLVKNAITQLELNLTRVANAANCYRRLSPILLKDDFNST